MEAEGEGVHEDSFEEGEGEEDDWTQLLTGQGQEGLGVFDGELQEVGDVAVAKYVDALPELVVHLAALHRRILEQRSEDPCSQAVPAQGAEI